MYRLFIFHSKTEADLPADQVPTKACRHFEECQTQKSSKPARSKQREASAKAPFCHAENGSKQAHTKPSRQSERKPPTHCSAMPQPRVPEATPRVLSFRRTRDSRDEGSDAKGTLRKARKTAWKSRNRFPPRSRQKAPTHDPTQMRAKTVVSKAPSSLFFQFFAQK